MSEIMRCVFERREPVRNVTALALMQYVCEEFPRSRSECVRRTFAECCSLDLLGTYVGAVMNGIDLDDDSIAVSAGGHACVREPSCAARREPGEHTQPSPPCRIRSGGRTLLTPRSLTSRSSTYRLMACRESRYG